MIMRPSEVLMCIKRFGDLQENEGKIQTKIIFYLSVIES